MASKRQRKKEPKNTIQAAKSSNLDNQPKVTPIRSLKEQTTSIWAHPYFTFTVPVLLLSICYALIVHSSVKAVEPLFGYVLAARYVDVVSVLFLVVGWMSTRYQVYRSLLGPVGAPHIQKLGLLDIDKHQSKCFVQISACALLLAGAAWTSDFMSLLVAGQAPLELELLFKQLNQLDLRITVQAWLQPHLVHSICLYPISFLLGCVAGRIPAATALPYVHRSVQEKHLAFSKFIVPILWFLASNLTRNVMNMLQVALWNPHRILATVAITMAAFAGIFIPSVYWTYSGMRRYLQVFISGIAISLAIYSFKTSPHLTSTLYEPQGIQVHDEFRILSKAGHTQVIYDRARDALFMRAAHSLIGGVYRVSLDSVFAGFYLHDLHRLIKRDESEPKRLNRGLVIGYGVGVATQSYAMMNVSMDIVDIDRNVIDLARTHFPLFAPTTKTSIFEPAKSWNGKNLYTTAFTSPVSAGTGDMNFHIDDGRTFIERVPTGAYDFMIHDVFTGGSVPSSLFTFEMMVHIRRVLRPGGTLSLNFVGSAHTMAFRNIAKTIKAVFPHVSCFSEAAPGEAGITNILFLARDRPINIREPVEEEYFGSEMRWYALTKLRAHVIQMPPTPLKSLEINATSTLGESPSSTMLAVQDLPTNEQDYFDWREGENSTAFEAHENLSETRLDKIVLRVSVKNQESSKTSKARARPRLVTDEDNSLLAEQLIPVAYSHWEIMRQLIPLSVWLHY